MDMGLYPTSLTICFLPKSPKREENEGRQGEDEEEKEEKEEKEEEEKWFKGEVKVGSKSNLRNSTTKGRKS